MKVRLAAILLLAAPWIAPGLLRAAEPTIRIGFNFVEPGQEVSIDFLNILDLKVHFMQSWLMVDPSSPFVTGGAFQGMTEQQVRDQIIQQVRKKFYDVPTSPGRELNIDLYSRPVVGDGSINVALGKYKFDSAGDHWFGQADLGEAMDNPTGKTMAVVALDEIATLPGPFDTPQLALNAIVNVTAHEIGHLYGLSHVCATSGCGDCTGGCQVVTDPYDVMATGPSGLPPAGWLQDNPFTSVLRTQPAGRSSIGTLLVNAGTRLIGDTDLDEDVDSADLSQLVVRWTGALAYNVGDRLWADGDFDHDQDVDSMDLTTVVQSWTGSAASGSQQAVLNYNPHTGNVQIASASDRPLASFVLASAEDAFRTDQLDLPWSEADHLTDRLAHQIGQFHRTGGASLTAHDLGPILAAGMNAEQLGAVLSSAQYAWAGGGGGQFQLVVVPEPAALLLLLFAAPLVGLAGRRRPAPVGIPCR